MFDGFLPEIGRTRASSCLRFPSCQPDAIVLRQAMNP